MPNSKINTFKTAFVIGNGKSRKDFDLSKLQDNGLIVGCNSIYKELDVDIICAMDKNVRQEIIEQDLDASFIGKWMRPYFDKTCQREMSTKDLDYAYINKSVNLSKAIQHYSIMPNSGLLALLITSWIEHINVIYLLGFDFFHPGANPEPNNMYHENPIVRPKNYTDTINEILAKCSHVPIIVVTDGTDESFLATLNITKTITYEEFETILDKKKGSRFREPTIKM